MGRTLTRLFFCFIIMGGAVACDDDGGPSDGGTDAAIQADAGAIDGGSEPPDAATGSDGGPSDAGPTDGGPTDGGPTDGGPTDGGPTDGGPTDAGPTDGGPTDGGPTDAGPTDGGPTDAGPTDGGSIDAGTGAGLMTYSMRRDTRRCPAPRCGGWWLTAVNRPTTACNDGTTAAECYVAEIDWSPSGYTRSQITRAEGAEGGTLIDGRITTVEIDSVRIGGFDAEAAWAAEWGSTLTDGRRASFHGLADNGMRCLTTPCFNTDLTLLNVGDVSRASGVDLRRTGASGSQIEQGLRAWADGTLRALGRLEMDAEPGTSGAHGETYVASQFYLPL